VDVAAAKVPGASFARCDLVVDEPRPPALAGWATHAVCSEVLEHVDDPETLLRNARALLAPGCRLVVTVPGGPMSAFDRHIGHRQHFTPALLAGLMRAAGYEVELTTGAGFPMFNLYRMVVVARGERLAQDVASGDGTPASLPARAAMGVFRALLALPLPRTRWGWQVVGVARLRDRGGTG
jgi:SAM-dependent methyltransferase